MRQIAAPSQKGPTGLAMVTFGRGRLERVLFKEGNYSGQTYNPEVPPEQSITELIADNRLQTGDYVVRLSGDGKKLYGLSPYNASVTARFEKFAAAEGQPPIPKHFVGNRQKRDGTTYPIDEMTFTAVMRCTGTVWPKYDGLSFPITLLYARNGNCLFADDGNGYAVIQGLSDKANFLASFISQLGGPDLLIPYSANILPDLEKALQEADIEVMCVLEKGWVTSISEAPPPPASKTDKAEKKPAAKKRK